MIICTGEDKLRLYKDCSAWEKACLKERLYQGCGFSYELSAKDYNYLCAFDCSADIPDDFCEKVYGETYWTNEDFLR